MTPSIQIERKMKKSFYVGFIMDFKEQIIRESLLLLTQNGLIFLINDLSKSIKIGKAKIYSFLLRKRSQQGNAINIYIVC